MAEPKYAKVNITALKAAMVGFKAGIAVHADDETKSIVDLFENMVLSYLNDDERNESHE